MNYFANSGTRAKQTVGSVWQSDVGESLQTQYSDPATVLFEDGLGKGNGVKT